MTEEQKDWFVNELRSIEKIDRNDFEGERHVNEVHKDILEFVEYLEDKAWQQGVTRLCYSAGGIND